MSSQPPNQTRTAPGRSGADTSSVSEKAKDVAGEAGGQAKQIAGEAKEQAREVVSDVKDHARDVMHDHRARRVMLLGSGYLAVWAAVGVAAFGLAAGADRLAEGAPGWAQAVAIGSCFVCGIYQMTPLKDRCLQKCRSPLGHLLHYASFRGPLADAFVGVHHGTGASGSRRPRRPWSVGTSGRTCPSRGSRGRPASAPSAPRHRRCHGGVAP